MRLDADSDDPCPVDMLVCFADSFKLQGGDFGLDLSHIPSVILLKLMQSVDARSALPSF